jgi:catechol 2,3-dioxygenase-like lactoylglutathione lyase family enzyme
VQRLAVVENTWPILKVENLDASVAYYVDKLGFKVDWREGGTGGVSRDNRRNHAL